jgi:hypothetical protein
MNSDSQEGVGMTGVKRDNTMVERTGGASGSGAGADIDSHQQMSEVRAEEAQMFSSLHF